MASLPGLGDECADEAGTDAAALMIGADFDTGEVDLGGTVFDVEHAESSRVAGPGALLVRASELWMQIYGPVPRLAWVAGLRD